VEHSENNSPSREPEWTVPLRDRLRANERLAPYTTLKIGGPAEWYYPAETTTQLIGAVRTARQAGVPFLLLGDGSNVLISDKGIRGLVIHNRAAAIERRDDSLFAEAGAKLSDLVERTRVEALTGLEFAAGIFGTVGGAIFGNAGAYGKSMADILAWVEILSEQDEVRRVGPAQMGFAYRLSACDARKWLVLSCEVRLAPGDPGAIGAEIDRILAVRATKLPSTEPSAGSYFKNIEDSSAEHGKIPAGQLLEAVGAKSLNVGGAAVYPRHANVIINRGGATAADVLELAAQMKARVRARYGIELQSEVRFLGEPL